MRFTLACLIVAAAVRVSAAAPAAAQLLPTDTLALASVPDWDKAFQAWTDSAYGKLWQDPALKAFKEKISQRFTDDLAAPLQRELGIRFADYLDLLHGQLTLAITQNGWGTRPDARPGFLLVADAKEKQEALKARLDDLKKKWTDSGRHLRSEKVRDVDLTTLIVSDDELSKTMQKAFPGQDQKDDPDEDEPAAGTAPKKAQKTEITFGQSGSLLIVGNNLKDLENLLARQSGASLGSSLAEQAAYDSSHTKLFRDTLGFAWVNFARVYDTLEKQLSGAAKGKDAAFAPRPDKILAATGLSGVQTIALSVNSGREGTSAEALVSVPESRRQGLFKLLALEKRDAGPPPFVGADVIKFKRWRIDGQKAWAVVENMLKSISPEIAGLVQMGFQAAGKEKDPNFDLKKALVGNLGNDFISFEKAPRSSRLRDLIGPPSLFLVGSANAEQLVQGLRAGTSLMPLAGAPADLNEREFLGRKIYSVALPGPPALDDESAAPAPRSFSFASSGGYAAMSTDASLLEAYLRSSDSPAKPLRELPGLSEAAEKVGGMSTGFFGYDNQAEEVRIWLESAKKESAALEKLLSLAPLPGGKSNGGGEEGKNVKDWMDVTLLPPFDRISKYFSFFVYSLSSTDDGLNWKLFAPTPPQLR